MVLALAASMIAAPQSGSPTDEAEEARSFPFSFGIGYVVAEQRRSAVESVESVESVVRSDTATPTPTSKASSPAPSSSPQAEPKTTSLAPRLPPPRSDLARIKGSPRARGLTAAAAIATQMAMIIAGIAVVREQREQAREARRGQPPPYRPYR